MQLLLNFKRIALKSTENDTDNTELLSFFIKLVWKLALGVDHFDDKGWLDLYLHALNRIRESAEPNNEFITDFPNFILKCMIFCLILRIFKDIIENFLHLK